MVKDKIRARIGKENWKFSQLLQLQELAESLSTEMMEELSTQEKISLVWDKEIRAGIFGAQFNRLVKDWLTHEIVQVFKERFQNATVSFEKESTEMLPPPPTENPSHVTSKEGMSKELREDKQINTPEQEIDITKNSDEIQTRAGNVKVKRL